MRRILGWDDPIPTTPDIAYVREPDDNEPDRITVHAQGIAVDVIANADGTVYVEAYATASDQQAIVAHANIDRYTVRHPNLRLYTVPRVATGTVTR
jgi:hypothetical protein